MQGNRQMVNCKDCKFFIQDPHSETRGVCMNTLAEQKGIPFRTTAENTCSFGTLDNLKKGAIV